MAYLSGKTSHDRKESWVVHGGLAKKSRFHFQQNSLSMNTLRMKLRNMVQGITGTAWHTRWGPQCQMAVGIAKYTENGEQCADQQP